MELAGRAQNAIIAALVILMWLGLQAVWQRFRDRRNNSQSKVTPFRPWRFAYRSAERASLFALIVASLWQMAGLIGVNRLAEKVGEAAGMAVIVGLLVWIAAAVLVVGPVLIRRRLATQRETGLSRRRNAAMIQG